VINDAKFRELCALKGDVLSRPPKGYDPGHPLIDGPQTQGLHRSHQSRLGRGTLAAVHRSLHFSMHRRFTTDAVFDESAGTSVLEPITLPRKLHILKSALIHVTMGVQFVIVAQ